MIRRPPRSTQSRSSAASDVYKRQRQALREADLSGQFQRPKAGFFAKVAWTLGQQSSQLFSLGRIETPLDGQWYCRPGRQALQARSVESIDRIEGGVRVTAQLGHNPRCPLAVGACQQNLAAAQHKGVRRT